MRGRGTNHQDLISHKAILDYLSASGFNQAFTALKTESENNDFVPDPKQKYAGLLEKKWTSVIRLQKKVSKCVCFREKGTRSINKTHIYIHT